jgi:hypothetical protein
MIDFLAFGGYIGKGKKKQNSDKFLSQQNK